MYQRATFSLAYPAIQSSAHVRLENERLIDIDEDYEDKWEVIEMIYSSENDSEMRDPVMLQTVSMILRIMKLEFMAAGPIS